MNFIIKHIRNQIVKVHFGLEWKQTQRILKAYRIENPKLHKERGALSMKQFRQLINLVRAMQLARSYGLYRRVQFA